nr:T9SS type A sorting domain-containing protein [Salinivirgaceae bacterium]
IVNGQFITDNNVDINVDASSSFIIESGLVAKNNSVLVISGTMTINADVLVENNATFNVGTNGLLAVYGDVGFGSKGELTVDGLMTIGGDLTGAATLDGSGTVTVGGTIAPSITDSNSVLPIELTYFKAYQTNNKVSFKWETASELNNDFFTIERSEDGVNFSGIETIGGAGNSLSSIVYSANDENPINGINYYRLKQTDYNGDYSYSELQAVEISRFSTKEINELVIYPNPIVSSNHLLSIDIKGEYHNESARIKIFGMNGQEIIEYEVPLDGNFNKTAIYISILTTGNYIVMVLTSSNSFKNKLVVL